VQTEEISLIFNSNTLEDNLGELEKIFLCQLGEIQVCTPSHSNSGEFQCDKDQFIERSVPANSKQNMTSMSLATTL
jgi:hypothetical protein